MPRHQGRVVKLPDDPLARLRLRRGGRDFRQKPPARDYACRECPRRIGKGFVITHAAKGSWPIQLEPKIRHLKNKNAITSSKGEAKSKLTGNPRDDVAAVVLFCHARR